MTYTDSRIPSIILADDGTPNPDDTVDVSAQISNNFGVLSQVAGISHVANAAALPNLNNFTGRLAMTDNDGLVYEYNGGWQPDHDTKLRTYTPTITTSGNPFIYGTGPQQVGYWRLVAPKVIDCKAYIMIGGGGGLNGGSGGYFINTPPWATIYPGVLSIAILEQILPFKLYTNTGTYANLFGGLLVAQAAPSGYAGGLYLDAPNTPMAAGQPTLAANANMGFAGTIYLA